MRDFKPGSAASFEFCRRLARSTGKNFYFSFLGLPREQFNAMCVLYSFLRISDDLGDDASQPLPDRQRNLDHWEHTVVTRLTNAAANTTSSATDLPVVTTSLDHHVASVLPALEQVVRRFEIPLEGLLAVLRGVRGDLQFEAESAGQPLQARFETFDELQAYCHDVAGVVGQCCLHIWGFTDPRALDIAIDCGLALQLTNILRDLGEDADNGRVYLPAEDLRRFGYAPEDIASRVLNDQFLALMQFQVARTRGFYERSQSLFELLKPPGRPILTAMLRLYGGLLEAIEQRRFNVYRQRVSLPLVRKLWIAGRAVLAQHLSRVRP